MGSCGSCGGRARAYEPAPNGGNRPVVYVYTPADGSGGVEYLTQAEAENHVARRGGSWEKRPSGS